MRRKAVAGVARRLQVLRRRGSDVFCPVCESGFDRFKDDWNRGNALCWRCGSHERHRAQWLLLEQRPRLLRDARRLLHFAPEWCLRRRLGRVRHLDYVTADLLAPGVDLRLDITQLALGDASFDAVLCSHVLEHVEDDAAAMRELQRVTAPGGWCLVMVPLDLGREHTLEDSTVTSPHERTQTFWQHDHVRLYAADIAERLAAAGFNVERIRPQDAFPPELVSRCRIGDAEDLWLCRPR